MSKEASDYKGWDVVLDLILGFGPSSRWEGRGLLSQVYSWITNPQHLAAYTCGGQRGPFPQRLQCWLGSPVPGITAAPCPTHPQAPVL